MRPPADAGRCSREVSAGHKARERSLPPRGSRTCRSWMDSSGKSDEAFKGVRSSWAQARSCSAGGTFNSLRPHCVMLSGSARREPASKANNGNSGARAAGRLSGPTLPGPLTKVGRRQPDEAISTIQMLAPWATFLLVQGSPGHPTPPSPPRARRTAHPPCLPEWRASATSGLSRPPTGAGSISNHRRSKK